MARKHVSDLQVCLAYWCCNDILSRRHLGKTVVVPWPEELLSLWTKEPQKVCLRAMERAHRRGLILCGVSLRSGWLTDAGYALIHA